MRKGFLLGGIVLVLLGFGTLVAVGNSVAQCGAGCTANPVGLSLGVILLVFGLILLILAFVLKPHAAATTSTASPTPVIGGRFCSACGSQNAAGTAFCVRCGKPLPQA